MGPDGSAVDTQVDVEGELVDPTLHRAEEVRPLLLHAVDEALGAGGLEAATDDDVKAVLTELLAADAPTATLRTTLSSHERTLARARS